MKQLFFILLVSTIIFSSCSNSNKNAPAQITTIDSLLNSLNGIKENINQLDSNACNNRITTIRKYKQFLINKTHGKLSPLILENITIFGSLDLNFTTYKNNYINWLNIITNSEKQLTNLKTDITELSIKSNEAQMYLIAEKLNVEAIIEQITKNIQTINSTQEHYDNTFPIVVQFIKTINKNKLPS